MVVESICSFHRSFNEVLFESVVEEPPRSDHGMTNHMCEFGAGHRFVNTFGTQIKLVGHVLFNALRTGCPFPNNWVLTGIAIGVAAIIISG